MEVSARDEHWMRAAIQLGQRGLGTTWPNPSVGCILVRNECVVGRGRTQAGGRPHGEVVALAQAGPDAKDATAYVSLEPCSHQGETPPCAKALIDANVARVVIAASDPDPRVNGKGVETLRSAGIEVVTGVCAMEAEAANIGFLTRVRENRPYLTLKLATTLDGKIATKTGESKWITGPGARRDVHLNRSLNDAIMVGRGTVDADDPMLDVRDMGAVHSPLRIVLDTELATSTNARIFHTSPKLPTWIICADNVSAARKSVFEDVGVRVIPTPRSSAAGLDLKALMERLASEGLTRIYCEGGATLAANLVQSELVDELHLYQAGKIFGNGALQAIAALNFERLSDSPKFAFKNCADLGGDTRSIWTRT